MSPQFFRLNKLAAAIAVCSVVPAVEAATSPSTSVDSYLDSHLPGVFIESILTVDDGSVPKTGGGTTRLVGIPDGMGAIDGADLSPAEPDFFYLLVNHELSAAQGVTRDHGGSGAFVSKWKIRKDTHEVVEGDDLIKQFYSWDEGTQSFFTTTTDFDRMCSADLPEPTALYNAASGLGSQAMIYLNGEETSGGRALAHIVNGADAGNSYHLHHLGYAAFENVVLSPTEQDATVAVMMDDDTDGEVYVYVGNKQNTGNEVEKAGLVGGNLYAIAIPGKPYELATDLATNVDGGETVELKLIGTPGDRPVDGADVHARGADTIAPVDPAQTFESLKMGGPEDGAWDTRPGYENVFYFVTKGTSANGITAPTRLWQLTFNDIANPAAGATLTMLLDGPENRLGSLDNMTFDIIDGQAKLYIQEDLGGDARLSKVWEYDIASGTLEEVAGHAADLFVEGGSSFFTTNEESSGIISLRDILGEGWLAASVQVHTSAGLSDSNELVENGQLVLMDVSNRGNDFNRRRLIANGDTWDYRVDGAAPGTGWNDTGYLIDGNWNQTTDGVATGPATTMLGYGEAPGSFATDVGTPAEPRPAAYYFRHEFDLANPEDVVLFDLYMKVDDGAVVYINGVEVARYNMDLDLAVDNDTYASANEASERDWKQISVTGEQVNLQPTGNVVAVSVHQENDASSDMRLDLELIAWNESTDSGVSPAVPTNLAVGGATQTSLDLSWDAQSDARFFRIERQAQGDEAWEVIEPEYPGTFTHYTDNDAQSGETYHYRLWAINIHGRSDLSAVASGATEVSLTPVIFEETFETPDSLGQFTSVDVAASDRNWEWVSWDFGSTGAVQGNNYGSEEGATEDWLILNDPINFGFYQDETLEYDSQISFSGPAPQVLYSTDYDPAVDNDPNNATWTLINEDTTAFGELTKVGPFDIAGIPDTGYIAFKYTGDGGAGGQSARFTVDDVIIKGECGYDFEGANNADIEADADTPWSVFNVNSAYGWQYYTAADKQGAVNNNFGSGAGGDLGGTASDDYLVSPPLYVAGPQTRVEFSYYENYGDTLDQPLTVLVTNAYTGDPTTTSWTDITPSGLNGSTSDAWITVASEIFSAFGDDVRVAFRYQSAGNGGGTTKRIGVDDVCVKASGGALEAGFAFNRNGGDVTFVPNIEGGVAPYTIEWDFGDGNTATSQGPTHTYTAPGVYTVTMTVTDDEGNVITETQSEAVTVTEFTVPEPADLRVATFNASMNRASAGELAADLASGSDEQIATVAEVIQRANPDVVLLNEFDQVYDEFGNYDRRATEGSIRDFIENYLAVAQADDVDPVSYRYFYFSPANTGVPSGYDLNNDGDTSDPEDAFGFGEFPGQYAMVILSKHRILDSRVRTFQNFLWNDMPGALLPPDPEDTDGNGDTGSYFTPQELNVVRLSSKTHIDVPIQVRGMGIVNLLASHPTPPVFDDGTATSYPSDAVADWNGLRNHDEIRFWVDYVNPANNRYIYDDREWDRAGGTTPARPRGGLRRGSKFVILGDQNADPADGDATFNPAQLLLSSDQVDTSLTPTSAGAQEQVPGSFSNRATKTSSFNLRADYVLPSKGGWDLVNAWVFWPESTDLEADVLGASDHRMVVIDLER